MISAASRTVFVTGPIWSSDEANATRPKRETRPYVGLSPTTPHSAAGCRIEPPVSEPSAPKASSAATAAAEPPLDPPGTRDRSHGLRVDFSAEFSVDEPMANSSRLVLPNGIAPAARNFSITVASYGERYPCKIFDAHVHGWPITLMMSLIAIGIPPRGKSTLACSA